MSGEILLWNECCVFLFAIVGFFVSSFSVF
jgi:hypothetical protein